MAKPNILSMVKFPTMAMTQSLSNALQEDAAPTTGDDTTSQSSSASMSSLLKAKSSVVLMLQSWGREKSSGASEKGVSLDGGKYTLTKTSSGFTVAGKESKITKRLTGQVVILGKGDGSVMLGKVDKEGRPKEDSTTRLYLSDGTKVKGKVKHGEVNGKGYVKSASGIKITGKFVNGMFQPDQKQKGDAGQLVQKAHNAPELGRACLTETGDLVYASVTVVKKPGGATDGATGGRQSPTRSEPETVYSEVKFTTKTTSKKQPQTKDSPSASTSYVDTTSASRTDDGATGGTSGKELGAHPKIAPKPGKQPIPGGIPPPLPKKPLPPTPVRAEASGDSTLRNPYDGITAGESDFSLSKEEQEILRTHMQKALTKIESLAPGEVSLETLLNALSLVEGQSGPTGKSIRNFQLTWGGNTRYTGERIARQSSTDPNKKVRERNGVGVQSSSSKTGFFVCGAFNYEGPQGDTIIILGNGTSMRTNYTNGVPSDSSVLTRNGNSYLGRMKIDIETGKLYTSDPLTDIATGKMYMVSGNGTIFTETSGSDPTWV
ncbi:MAG: hypothetical protein ACRCV3_02635 [Desulfovibrionaceae bacterium]